MKKGTDVARDWREGVDRELAELSARPVTPAAAVSLTKAKPAEKPADGFGWGSPTKFFASLGKKLYLSQQQVEPSAQPQVAPVVAPVAQVVAPVMPLRVINSLGLGR